MAELSSYTAAQEEACGNKFKEAVCIDAMRVTTRAPTKTAWKICGYISPRNANA